MNFPTINTIDQVLPYVRHREEFKVSEKGNYTVINYMVSMEDSFDCPIRRECRGLVFNSDGKLISRPYHKFHNLNEKEHTQLHNVDFKRSHIFMEKLDGSMVHACILNQQIRLMTRAGITDESLAAERFIQNNKDYYSFLGFVLTLGWCPIFEWCSRSKPNVIRYASDNLILTGLRALNSGKYADYDYMNFACSLYRIPLVQVFSYKECIESIAEQVKNWTNREGIVIRYNDGEMLKIKSLDYVLKHKARDEINLEKNVLSIILEDKLDDVLSLLSEEDHKKLSEFQHNFWVGFNDTIFYLKDLYHSVDHSESDDKQFSLNFVSRHDKKYRSFLFAIHRNKDLRQELIEYIKFHLGSSTRIETVRWVWGNHRW